MASASLVVVGSCNLDQVLTVVRAPGPGETVGSEGYVEEPGGKGLNQALAAARMGAAVRFVGAVGDDEAGRLVRRTLQDSGVDTGHLREVPGPTGRAVIVVDAERENRIVLLGGANTSVVSLDSAARAAVTAADGLLVQLELPLPVVVEAAQAAARAGVPVALTPAPVQPLADELLAATSVLFANEHEMVAITGERDLDTGLATLLDLVPAALVTRGAQGSDYVDRSGRRHHQQARTVEPVDTTAAGDVYAGVFMSAYCSGAGVEVAMARATTAASLAVGRRGTSGSIPTAPEVDAETAH